MPTDATEYEASYAKWQESAEKDLGQGKGFIQGDKELLKHPAQHADQHVEFLQTRLKAFPFAEIILQTSNIDSKYRSELKNVRDVHKAQRKWIGVLDRILYERRFAEWRAELDAEVKKGKEPTFENSDLSRYLANKAAENVEFLKYQLARDRFTVLILENSSMYGQYPGRVKKAESLERRQRAWSEFLMTVQKSQADGQRDRPPKGR